MSITYGDLPSTNFPDSLDTFITNADISITDAILVAQFQEAVQQQDFTLAQQILAQIPNYTQKILTASKLNKFNECIQALERFYSTDISAYITQKQAEWQQITDEFGYQDTYSPVVQYEVNNYVLYSISGVQSLYIVYARPPIGTAPNNTSYWRMLTVRGQRGPSGSNMVFMGDWNTTTSYVVMNCVTYDNALWGCLVANTNQTPCIGSTYWQQVYQGGATVYPVTVETPTGQEDGALWFQILPDA